MLRWKWLLAHVSRSTSKGPSSAYIVWLEPGAAGECGAHRGHRRNLNRSVVPAVGPPRSHGAHRKGRHEGVGDGLAGERVAML